MRLVIAVCFTVFFMPFVYSFSADISCPENVGVNDEFTCTLEVDGGSGVYDAKIEIMKDGKTVADVFNPFEEKWKSAYYYIKEFIESGETKDMRVKVEEQGSFDAVLKIRQGSAVELVSFEISAGSTKKESEFDDTKEESEEVQEEDEIGNQEEKVVEVTEHPEEQEIVLNSISQESIEEDTSTSKTPIYESKSARSLRVAPYVFIVFLIVVIAVLFWEKRQ